MVRLDPDYCSEICKLLASFPLTPDAGRWFFGYSAAALAVLLVFAFTAMRFALGASARPLPERA